MDRESLIAELKRDELILEATPLVAWETGAVADMDGVAQFLSIEAAHTRQRLP